MRILKYIKSLIKSNISPDDYFPNPKDFHLNFSTFAKNIYSQNGEDGIIEELLKRLNIQGGWACEFGAWDGKHLSNTFNLVANFNWNCVMIESDKEKFLDLQKTANDYSNIHPLNETVHYIKGYGKLLDDILDLTDIPDNFHLLSIDVDSCDYHIWKSLKRYKPKIVIIECSGLKEYIIQREGAIHKKDKDGSTSLLPLKELGEQKGYKLLCNVGNLIFLRNDSYELLS